MPIIIDELVIPAAAPESTAAPRGEPATPQPPEAAVRRLLREEARRAARVRAH